MPVTYNQVNELQINEDEHIIDILATNQGDPANFGIDSIYIFVYLLVLMLEPMHVRRVSLI